MKVGSIKMYGYCPNCKKMVEVALEPYIDADDDGVYEGFEEVCPECGGRIPHCVECANFRVFDEDRDRAPWYDARGCCPLGVVLARNRACPLFEEA
jgi:hypothetical protein